MAAELLAGLGVFKSMLDTAKGLKDINDVAVRNEAVIELQEKILSAQALQAALIERVRELEQKVTRYEAWETEKNRYRLESLQGGGFAYTLKDEESAGEPPHKICAHCYEEGRKSILKMEHWQPYHCEVLVCNNCGSVIYLTGQPNAGHQALRPKPRH